VTRSGFVALAGRPNVGKSTLVNRIVGEKVAIVSERPQTTRRALRGIATLDDCQLVLVDLPGVQRPRDPLTERMQRRMQRELEESDVALFILNGDQGVGPGDRFIAAAIRAAGVPTVTVVYKLDLLKPHRAAEMLTTTAALDLPGEVFPVSALRGTGVAELVEHISTLVPEGPFMYPPDERTDLPERVRLAELVREQVLRRTRQEVPHAVEVEVEEIEELPSGVLRVEARIWTETESQKAILIGSHGRMITAIGTSAREEIESLEGRLVFLDLGVRVRRGWRGDEALLDRLGIE
jgi:GTP-binding protein Era